MNGRTCRRAIGCILNIMSNIECDAGWQTAKCLRDTPEIDSQDVLSGWVSVFSGVSVISDLRHFQSFHHTGTEAHEAIGMTFY
jgi:hypothetical protein